jgi:hypothetical protein
MGLIKAQVAYYKVDFHEVDLRQIINGNMLRVEKLLALSLRKILRLRSPEYCLKTSPV